MNDCQSHAHQPCTLYIVYIGPMFNFKFMRMRRFVYLAQIGFGVLQKNKAAAEVNV